MINIDPYPEVFPAFGSIRFKLVPIKTRFSWNKEQYTKTDINHAINSNGLPIGFPLEFKVDMTLDDIEKILGPQTEPGAWGNPDE